MNRWLFSLQMLRRDIRAGELRVLLLALVVAVASVSSVGFFTDRIQQALRLQANELLAADLVISADHPIRESFVQQAQRARLQTVMVHQFRSMVFAAGKNSLAELKVAAEGYPLRGKLKIADVPLGADREVRAIPEPGTLWVEVELLRRLNLNLGDSLEVGAHRFRITQIITYEPDRSGGFFSIAPRILMNSADLPATGLIQEGSRVRYKLLLAGKPEDVARYDAKVRPDIQRGERIIDVTDSRQEVREALNRSNQFLGLAALVSVMLAGVAVAMASRRHVVRHLDNCAIMRCVGARQADITWVYTYEMLWLGLIAVIIGCAIGYLGHAVLIELLAVLFVAKLPAATLWPVVHGLFTGLVALLGFAIPPLLHLQNVPTLRVLRRELGMLRAPTLSVYAIAIGCMMLLLLVQARDIRLGLYVLGGLVLTIVVLIAMALLMVHLLRRLTHGSGAAWRFGMANVARRPRSSVIQVLAFGVGIMSLMLLALVRGELLVGWQQRLPPETPNRFIINMQQNQLAGMQQFFSDQGLSIPATYPMVRGRLQAINDVPVSANNYEDARTKRLVEREFNLSWASNLQDDNSIVSGKWWGDGKSMAGQFSVEEDIAQHMGVKVGDMLTYNIAGEVISAPVSSLRKVQWDSFKANFFVLAPPGILDAYPATYITSFYLPDNQLALLADLVRQFPNFTVVDISAIMEKIRSIVQRVTDAVEYVFLFTLAAGLMVLYAAIQASHDERVRESAIIRTLGAGRRQLISGLVAEFFLIGMLAGVIAALNASLISFVVAKQVLQIPFVWNPWIWLWGLLGGGTGVALAGFLGTRGILNRPPLQTLRKAEA